MPPAENPGWTLVVPVKTLVAAKTRLSEAAGPHRAALAVAIACDTVEAALRCAAVARVVVVTGDPVAAPALAEVGAHVTGDPEAGLNAALRHGGLEAVRLAPGGPVGALQADLPALRPAELALVLAAAGEFDQSFLPDAAEVGTTFYGVRPGVPFTPGFGGPSRDRHLRRGAKELCLHGVESVRRDVDTPDDLRAALSLGVGPRTAEIAGRLAGAGMPEGVGEPEDAGRPGRESPPGGSLR
ncbi:2-phospho-L-lactate guanylyltransferase [Streptosporangium pseudovulgare]|uniref:Phosphoenolpyruvate guanylyltransferase n=1 Tax=Streptosporangium pseudovulgare TaxID=35765 RepID=A0ABQ2QXN4_9ACTN|nr:2-phospho-L-lactate guanylyltransferase [Streptosporangium pseudovulgare]GGQ03182.1 2-phospho-L-lactate guanylyltransferase [Streptosporangium pseudovulgare]